MPREFSVYFTRFTVCAFSKGCIYKNQVALKRTTSSASAVTASTVRAIKIGSSGTTSAMVGCFIGPTLYLAHTSWVVHIQRNAEKVQQCWFGLHLIPIL